MLFRLSLIVILIGLVAFFVGQQNDDKTVLFAGIGIGLAGFLMLIYKFKGR